MGMGMALNSTKGFVRKVTPRQALTRSLRSVSSLCSPWAPLLCCLQTITTTGTTKPSPMQVYPWIFLSSSHRGHARDSCLASSSAISCSKHSWCCWRVTSRSFILCTISLSSSGAIPSFPEGCFMPTMAISIRYIWKIATAMAHPSLGERKEGRANIQPLLLQEEKGKQLSPGRKALLSWLALLKGCRPEVLLRAHLVPVPKAAAQRGSRSTWGGGRAARCETQGHQPWAARFEREKLSIADDSRNQAQCPKQGEEEGPPPRWLQTMETLARCCQLCWRRECTALHSSRSPHFWPCLCLEPKPDGIPLSVGNWVLEGPGVRLRFPCLPKALPLAALGRGFQGIHPRSLPPCHRPALKLSMGTLPSLCPCSAAMPSWVRGLCPELPGAARLRMPMLSHTTTLPPPAASGAPALPPLLLAPVFHPCPEGSPGAHPWGHRAMESQSSRFRES